jgi:excisionase family DNA binding protein
MPAVRESVEVESALLTITDARRILGGISIATVYGLINEKKLKAVRIGKRIFVRRTDLYEFIDNLT